MNTLTHLSVAGFRSLKQIEWKPGALNLLIGPNGSGKSNIVKAIEMLSCCARGTLSKFVEREGGFGAIAWDGGSNVSFGINVNFGSAYRGTNSNVAYRINLEPEWFGADYQIAHEEIGAESIPLVPFEFSGTSIRRSSETILFLIDEASQELELDESARRESIMFIKPRFAADLAYDTHVFSRVAGSFRVYRHLNTAAGSRVRTSVVARHEEQVSEDGENVMQVLHTLYSENREFKSDVNKAMSAAFGDDFEELTFPPASDQRIQMRVRWRSLKKEQSAADLSDGTLRFLYLLAILGTPKPPPLIAIEEPEVGLHPSMLPIIAEFAQAAAEKTQVILTTHSSAMLDAFTDEPPQVTVTTWQNGETELHTMSGEQLASWLDEYTLGDLYRSGELEAME